jgi:hypothetical protein
LSREPSRTLEDSLRRPVSGQVRNVGFSPEILGGRLDLTVPINQQDPCPSPREALRDGASDPARRPGDDARLAAHIEP